VRPKLLHQIPEPFIERAARKEDAFSNGFEVYSCDCAFADERKIERPGVPDFADIRLTLLGQVNRPTVGGDNYLPIGSDDGNGGSVSDRGEYEEKDQPEWVRHRYNMLIGCLVSSLSPEIRAYAAYGVCQKIAHCRASAPALFAVNFK
jgi:hypothetical protein